MNETRVSNKSSWYGNIRCGNTLQQLFTKIYKRYNLLRFYSHCNSGMKH